MGKFSTKDKIDELERELRQRERVYPRLLSEGKLNPNDARRQIWILQAILADYEAIARLEPGAGEQGSLL
jgi:hypothetical protein